MPRVKFVDPVETSSADLHLLPGLGINQVVEIYKVVNSSSCKYLTELILDMIKYPEEGTQEIPTP